MEKPRILMVLDHRFPPDIRVENEAVTLVEEGFDVGLLSIGPDTRPAREVFRGIRIFRNRIPKEVRNKMRGLAGTFPLLTRYLDWKIGHIYRKWPFHALHMHDLYLVGGGLRASRRLGIPVVADLHEHYSDVLQNYAWSTRFPGKLLVSIPRWKRLERRWVHASDRVIVTARESLKYYQSIGAKSSRMIVVPNTIQCRDFDQYLDDNHIIASIRSDFTMVYTGTINLHRGLDSVIRALPRVLEVIPAAKLVIVGEGRIRPELEALGEELGVSANVHFTGWRPQSELKSYILGSSVGLLPLVKRRHTDHATPHKLFHYMYLERPIVASNCQCMERIITECKSGVVYPSGDVEALSEALLSLATNSERRQELGQNGKRAVTEEYNWDTTVRPMVRMYEELTASG